MKAKPQTMVDEYINLSVADRHLFLRDIGAHKNMAKLGEFFSREDVSVSKRTRRVMQDDVAGLISRRLVAVIPPN